jgi:chromosome segregation ATPase
MATSVPKDLPEIVKFFEMLGQRDDLRQSLEADIVAHEQQLAGQRQEVQDLRAEKQALLTCVRALMAQLEDLSSEVPTKAQELEGKLGDLRREVAAEAEQLRRLQAYGLSLKQQTGDAEQYLSQIKSQIMGGEAQVRARTFARPASLAGPAIINSGGPDDNPRELDASPEEASA